MRTPRPALIGFLLAASLSGCGADPVAEQLARLRNGGFEAKLAAIDQLRDAADDPRVVPALVAAIGNEPAAEVRIAATTVLGRTGKATPFLLGVLDDPAEPVRIAAAIALVRRDPAIEAGRDILIEAMLAGDGPVFLAVGRLGPDGAWATPTLVRLLGNRSARLRNVAARTLGRIGPGAAEALDALRRAESDPEPGVRKQAAEAIRKIGATRENGEPTT